MPSPIVGILTLSVFFAISSAAALVCRLVILYREYLNSPPEEKDPKIYYIEKQPKKRKKRRRPKKPNVALKGIVIEPEKFKNLSEREILSLPDADDI